MSGRANTGAVFGLESPVLSGTTTNTHGHAKLHKQPPTPTDQVQCASPHLPICYISEKHPWPCLVRSCWSNLNELADNV